MSGLRISRPRVRGPAARASVPAGRVGSSDPGGRPIGLCAAILLVLCSCAAPARPAFQSSGPCPLWTDGGFQRAASMSPTESLARVGPAGSASSLVCKQVGDERLLLISAPDRRFELLVNAGEWEPIARSSDAFCGMDADPEARHVYYVASDGQRYELWRCTTGRPAREPVKLTADDAVEDSPSVSSTGAEVVFIRHWPDRLDDLVLFVPERFTFVTLARGRSGLDWCMIEPAGGRAMFRDHAGLWRIGWSRRLSPERPGRIDCLPGMAPDLPAGAGQRDLFRAGVWWTGRPAVLVRDAGLFILEDTRWTLLPGSDALVRKAGSDWTLFALNSGGLSALFLLDPPAPGRAPVAALAAWSSPRALPVVDAVGHKPQAEALRAVLGAPEPVRHEGGAGERTGSFRAEVRALDSEAQHQRATGLIVSRIAEAKAGPLTLADLGVVEWFAFVEPRVLRRGELGHLPFWLDERLRRVIGACEAAGAAGEARLLRILAAWTPEEVELQLGEAEKAGDARARLAAHLVLGSYWQGKGEIEAALAEFTSAALLSGQVESAETLSWLRKRGPLEQARAWRWLEAERAGLTGPWAGVRPIAEELDALRALLRTSAPSSGTVPSLARPTGADVRAWRAFVKRFPDSNAADAARVRLSAIDAPWTRAPWLWEVVRDRPGSAFFTQALDALVGVAASQGTAALTAQQLTLLQDRWSHRERAEAIGRAVRLLDRAAGTPDRR